MKMSLLIIGMLLVTYLPRYLPFRCLDVQAIHPLVRRFLHHIPYAALGALIVPDVFSAVEGNTPAAILGALVAAIAAYKTKSVVVAVLSAVLVSSLISLS